MATLFLPDSAKDELKPFITHILEEKKHICQADPNALADYALALLQHKKPKNDVKKLCVEQLEEFLKSETNSFVEKLFSHIESLEKKMVREAEAKSERERERERERDSKRRTRSNSPEPRKRRAIDREDRENREVHEDRWRQRQNRDRDRDRDRRRDRDPYRHNSPQRYGRHGRGLSHSPERINRPLSPYDPERAGMGFDPAPQFPRIGMWQMPPQMFRFPMDDRPVLPLPPFGLPLGLPLASNLDMNRRGKAQGRPRNVQGDENHNAPKKESTPTLRVSRIPPQLMDIAKLSKHFQWFGTVTNIQLEHEKKQAFVQFQTIEQAEKAFRSVKPVCGNRFITIQRSNYQIDPATEAESKNTETASASYKTTTSTPQGYNSVVSSIEANIQRKLEHKDKIIDLLNQGELSAEKRKELISMLKSLAVSIEQETRSLEKLKSTASLPKQANKLQESESVKDSNGQPEPEQEQEQESEEGRIQKLEKDVEQLEELANNSSSIRGISQWPVVRGRARGRARGRGRGWTRGRSVSRGTLARMTLDNRTKSIYVTHIPDEVDESGLTAAFEVISKPVSIYLTSEHAIVEMATRGEAEAVMAKGVSVSGKALQLEWYDPKIDTDIHDNFDGEIEEEKNHEEEEEEEEEEEDKEDRWKR